MTIAQSTKIGAFQTQNTAAPGPGNLAAIAPASDANTLLSYQALVTPDPLQISMGGTITLAVSNPLHQVVTVTSIELTLSVGTAAKDLATSLAALQLDAPVDWSATNDSGVITLTPTTPSAAQVGANGLSFVIAGFTVNDQVGNTPLTIDETAGTPSLPVEPRSASIRLPKFPQQFQVSDLQANPGDLASGFTTSLMWTGPATGPSGTAPTYKMNYQPADSGTPVSDTVSFKGPYTTKALTRANQVSFELRVSVPVAGLDEPLVLSRYAFATIESVSASLAISPTTVGPNGVVHLTWSSNNAATCSIDPAIGTVAANGEAYIAVSETRAITLNAYDAAGKLYQTQTIVTVVPSIRATETQANITGGNGGRGPDGRSGPMIADDGIDGGNGGDAIATSTLPALDPSSTPSRVIAFNLVGGNGGPGGNGGEDTLSDAVVQGGNAGNGGRGGDALLHATLDASQGVAQIMLNGTGGIGGQPGQPGDGPSDTDNNGWGYPGHVGRHGIVGGTINGLPLYGA